MFSRILVLVTVLLASGVAAAEPRPLVVVVAKGSTVKNLTRTELKRCFTSSPVVVDGERLVPFNYPPGTAERVAFDRLVLGMSPEEVGRFWVDRKIRGESAAPRALPSVLHVVKIVAKFPAAVSYVPADQVTADLVIVAIDGVMPGAAGYVLRPR